MKKESSYEQKVDAWVKESAKYVLGKWVQAVYVCYDQQKTCTQKLNECKDMESKLKAQMKILKVKEDQLDECNRKVSELKKQHEKSKKEKKKLTDQIETTE